jgi:hypothetical protein
MRSRRNPLLRVALYLAGDIESEHEDATDEEERGGDEGAGASFACGGSDRSRGLPVEQRAEDDQGEFHEKRDLPELPPAEAEAREAEGIAGEERQVVAVNEEIEHPVGEGDEGEDDGAAATPAGDEEETERGGEEERAEERVGVVGVDDVFAVAAVEAGDGLDGLDAHGKERDEEDVEPDGSQHERPERDLGLARFDDGGESEVAGDHGLTLLTGLRATASARQRGQGTPASTNPMTTTKRTTPRMNCMRW